jgi:TRAP-type C4-dicarboxylate transport system permease small subunit
MLAQEDALAQAPEAAPASRLLRLDASMTRFETALAVFAIAAEAVSMSVWVLLKALALHGGYFGNVLNYFQQASSLTLLGGLRGTATRFTLLLALVGGSLATARGKHVVVDVVARFARGSLRKTFVVLGFVASAAVSLAAAYGFFDHIAIQDFGADADSNAGAKVTKVLHELGEDAFIARTQLLLDLKSFSHVFLRAEPYAEWLHGDEWNAFLDDRGFTERYGREAVSALRIPAEDSRAPIVSIPGRGEPRGELIYAANLVYPIGLFVIGFRFLLRAWLVVTGQVGVEPDEESEPGRPAEPSPLGV